MRVEIELRYVPRFRVMDYLAQVGGTVTEMLCVVGDGWEAAIEALEPDQVGIVQVRCGAENKIGADTNLRRPTFDKPIRLRL
jgi:hypothetical protein